LLEQGQDMTTDQAPGADTTSTDGPGPAPAPPDTGGVDPLVYERRWAILGVLCLSLVLVVVGNSSLNVALPTLQESLHASSTQLQWIVDAYAIVFAGLLLPAGALGDRFGRKGALQLGLVVVGLASLLATFADSPNQLIATRAVMGLGAAFVMPATLSILANVFPPSERARAIAIWAGFSGAGAAIGPVLSGFLLGHFWWGSVFFVNVPIVVLALIGGAIMVPTSKDPNHSKLDPVGALFSVIALASLLYAIIEAPVKGWGSTSTVLGFVGFAVFAVAFVLWEQRSATPMLPMSFFRNRRFSVGATTITLTFFCMFGLFFVLTQYLQFVLGFTPFKAGLATLPLAAMLVIFAPRSAGFVARWGQARVQAVGLTLVAIGLLVVASLSPHSNYLWVALGLVIMGVGMACTTAPATNAIVSSVPLSKSGVGSAVNDTTREVGGALGIAVLGSLVSSAYRSTMAGSVGGLPPAAAAVARDSIGGAYSVAQGAGPAGSQLNSLAATAFTDAMSAALVAAAVVALVTAGIVLIFFPRTTPALIGPDGRPLDPNRPADDHGRPADDAASEGAGHGG
jgi:EmrB/QacA subfamily drug resistance transporter